MMSLIAQILDESCAEVLHRTIMLLLLGTVNE